MLQGIHLPRALYVVVWQWSCHLHLLEPLPGIKERSRRFIEKCATKRWSFYHVEIE
jgi:hypothetical protein